MDSIKMKRFLSRYWLLFPALLIYIIFLFYPMAFSLVVSFYEWDGLSPTKAFVGLKNYIHFFSDSTSILVLKNNLIWTVLTLFIPTLLGLTLAVMLNANIRARTVFRSIFYSPAVLPYVAVGLIWSWIYNPMFGAINSFLKTIGLGFLARPWLADPKTALYSVIVTAIWQGTGLPMILFLAGLQSIPKELYEASNIDGANSWQTFWYITLPSLRETLVIVVSLLTVNSLRVFDLVYTMTWGGPGKMTQVMGTWMYFNTFVYHRAGFGSAIAWVMTAMSLLIVYPYIRAMSKR